MDTNPRSYEMDLTATDSTLVVRLRGRVTAEAGRHLREIVRAAERCGLPVEVDLPLGPGRFGGESTDN